MKLILFLGLFISTLSQATTQATERRPDAIEAASLVLHPQIQNCINQVMVAGSEDLNLPFSRDGVPRVESMTVSDDKKYQIDLRIQNGRPYLSDLVAANLTISSGQWGSYHCKISDVRAAK